jgi:hypothetical protein
MHAWLRSQAERFAAEKDVRQIMAIGEAGIDEVFAELADAAERGEFAGGDDDLTPEEVAELEAAAERMTFQFGRFGEHGAAAAQRASAWTARRRGGFARRRR